MKLPFSTGATALLLELQTGIRLLAERGRAHPGLRRPYDGTRSTNCPRHRRSIWIAGSGIEAIVNGATETFDCEFTLALNNRTGKYFFCKEMIDSSADLIA